MSKIIIYTPAYNAEKTLRRAVDSVLNQTYTNFTYYLLDNAATDSTYEIVKEYAERDKRIIPLHNDKNWHGNGILDVIKNHSDDCYICELDADDEYAPDFLETMFMFIKRHSLDIAACGSDFIDAPTNKCLGIRKIEKNLVFDGDDFGRYFSVYYQFMRTIWGKVYSVSAIRSQEYEKYKINGYGADTIFAMNAFHNSNRIGIISESLHTYYVSPKSVSYQFDKNRASYDCILFDAARNFLISKCGEVSDENLNFLWIVYLNAIKDTLNVLLNSNISINDKLGYLLDIFQSSHTQELIKWSGAKKQKSDLFSQVASWMLSKNEIRNDLEFDIAADILVAMDIYPTKINGWQDGEVFILLAKIRDRHAGKGLLSPADSLIISITGKSPYLIGLDIGFLCYFRDIVFSILQNDEKNALSQIVELIVQEKEIPYEYVEALLMLALNLSAKLEYSDYFIYFKKLQISLLIDLFRVDEAIKEFANWDEILSDDIDFINLKERLNI